MSTSRLESAPAVGAARYRDPLLKGCARGAYRLLQGVASVAGARRAARGAVPRVFYGGARAGDRGGPLVKVQRLSAAFPEQRFGFNLFYSLSNCAYVPDWALRRVGEAGVPIVHNQNGVFYAAWYHGDWQRQNALMAAAYRRADHVFFQSAFCRRAAERFLGARDGPGEVLFNAVDTGNFAPSATAREAGRFRFLMTGKLDGSQLYRLEVAVEGLARLRAGGVDAELAFRGALDADGAARAARLGERLGVADHVQIGGAYSQADAPALYRAADAYVNFTHQDNCPNAVIEAMACGLPVLCLGNGGTPELVGDEAGVVLPAPEDWQTLFVPEPETVAAAMADVVAGREAMADAARRRAVAQFDLDRWVARHRAVFQALLADRGEAAA